MGHRASSIHEQRRGQTLIFMAMAIVMMAVATLFYFDVHKVLHVKATARNAGDAAALAAARWQAVSLNLIGDLNVAQAVAITDALAAGQTESPEVEIIADLQRRISFVGPLFGYLAAQQAAKQNGIHNRAELEEGLRAHAMLVEEFFGAGNCPQAEPFQPLPPMGSGWDEYADILRLIADHGMAVACNNARLFGSIYEPRNHMLLNPSFYDAIAARNWCWFYHGPFGLLQSYGNFSDWPGLYSDRSVLESSEYFSLRLNFVAAVDLSASSPATGESWEALLSSFTDEALADAAEWLDFAGAGFAWYEDFGSWSARIAEDFPWDRRIRERYDYAGADAAVRIDAVSDRHSDLQGANTIVWTAAAKPFGQLDGDLNPTAHGLVLPAYTDVRLIPVDTASGYTQGTDAEWLEFVAPRPGCEESFLELYLSFGPSVLPPGNYYAQQLLTWEDPAFRLDGIQWLNEFSSRCTRPPSGGGGSGGGTSHGH